MCEKEKGGERSMHMSGKNGVEKKNRPDPSFFTREPCLQSPACREQSTRLELHFCE